jgi:hypothetical protein
VNRRRQGRDIWVALGVAYLVVVQMLVTGIALGAQAAPNPQAGLSTVICSFHETATTGPDGTGQPSDHAHLPACCVLGCSMFGPTVAPPPSIAGMLVPRQIARAPVFAFADQPPLAGERRSSGNPRAPPHV